MSQAKLWIESEDTTERAQRVRVSPDQRREVENWSDRIRRLKTVDLKFDRNQESREACVNGMLGQYVAGNYFGFPTRLEAHVGRDRYDLKLGPWKTEVKTTREPWGGLPVTGELEFDVAVLVLCYVDKDDYVHHMGWVDVVGWVARERFERECGQRDMGNGMRRYMAQKHLSYPRDLCDLLAPFRRVNDGRRTDREAEL